MKIKKLMQYINSISTPAYVLLKISLIISILMMTASLVILLAVGEQNFDTYTYFALAKQLFAMPQSVLLIGGIFSAIIADISS